MQLEYNEFSPFNFKLIMNQQKPSTNYNLNYGSLEHKRFLQA